MLLVNHLGAIPRPPFVPQCSFQQSKEETGGGTTHSYSSMSFGAADVYRDIVCAIGVNNDRVPVSATIGGVSASILKSEAFENTGAALIAARVPSGTSGTVTVTWNSNPLEGSRCATFRVIGLNSLTPVATNSKDPGTGGNLNVNTLRYGVVFVAVGIVSSPPTTFSGVDQKTAQRFLTAGFASNVAIASPRAVNVNNIFNYSAVCVSLR